MILEACVQEIEEVKFAAKKGFKRVELCSSLESGGLTPSKGTIKQACKIKDIETHVMIRPRAGDFCYNFDEIAIMKADIKTCHKMGATGVVFGMLNENGKLALENIPLIQCKPGLFICIPMLPVRKTQGKRHATIINARMKVKKNGCKS